MGRIYALLIAVVTAVAGYMIGNQVWHGDAIGLASGNFHGRLEWSCLYATVSGSIGWIAALNVLWPRR